MDRNQASVAAVILAAGKGIRMKSETPKVLHRVAGKTMIERTIDTVAKCNPIGQIVVVASSQNLDALKKVLSNKVIFAVQNQPLGTADAVLQALEKLNSNVKTVAVLYGDDTAFYKSQTINEVFQKHQKDSAQITFVTVKKENPHGLGRIIRKNGKLTGIVEEKDATPLQKKINEVNDGLYFFQRDFLMQNLQYLIPSKATGELYLTDLIEVALKKGQNVETYLLKNQNQWHGINTKDELVEANLKLSKKIHFMGVAGAGASAVANIAQAFGFEVSGCDQNPDSSYTKNSALKIKKGHDKNHLLNQALLVVSPAILKSDPQNNEIRFAKTQGIPQVTWQEFQGKHLQRNKFVIATAGAYGKSTTTAMIGKIMEDASLDPTVEVGAGVLDWHANFRIGKSKYYVCEADEYSDNFLNYNPDIAVILNVSWDHPDFFKTEKELYISYEKFVGNIKKDGTLIIGSEARKKIKVQRPDIKIAQILDFSPATKLIGDFRKDNANAALTVSNQLGINEETAKVSVGNFSGLARRLENKGKIKNTLFYDDYAVQPYTIEKTTNALAKFFKNKKILLVLEPHTYSRIKTFFKDFVEALGKVEVSQIFITDVFAAREKGDKSTLSEKLAAQVGKKTAFIGTVENSATFVRKTLDKYDIVLSMGAGDIYKLYDLVKGNG